MQLIYRATFIDVIEDGEERIPLRSRSLPARLAKPSHLVSAEDFEPGAYVSSLQQRSQQLAILVRNRSQKAGPPTLSSPAAVTKFMHKRTSSTASTMSGVTSLQSSPTNEQTQRTATSDAPTTTGSDSPVAPDPTDGPSLVELSSYGSAGHPEVCQRPCLFFAQGDCQNGSSCGFCHLPHLQRPVHLDKRNRLQLQSLSHAEKLALLLPLLHEKAAAMAFQYAGKALELGGLLAELLQILEAWAAREALTEGKSLSRLEQQLQSCKLAVALRRVSFSSLLSHAMSVRATLSEDASMAAEAVADLKTRMQVALGNPTP